MNAEFVMRQHAQTLANLVRTPGKAMWRRVNGAKLRRHNSVRTKAAEIRAVRYGD